MKVRAAVARQPHGPFALEQLELGAPQAGEVLVRIVACGMCHADLIARDQTMPVPHPIVAGHEGAGVVEEVGSSVTGIAAGDRVLLSYTACLACEACLTGRPAYCLESFSRNFGGQRPDGTVSLSAAGAPVHSHFFGQSSFASHAVVPASNVVVVAPDAPLDLYAPLGCGVQTGAGAVMNSLAVPPGSSLAVFGTGSVGLSAVMAAQATGVVTVIAVDVVAQRLTLAAELGASATVNAADIESPAAAIRELTGGAGVAYALDTTGRPDTVRQAVESLSSVGTLGLVAPGSASTAVSFGLLELIVGRTVRGIQQGDSVPRVFIPRLIDMHRDGRLPLERLVSRFPFADINAAAQAQERGEVVKPVLMMDAPASPRSPGHESPGERTTGKSYD